MAQWYFTKNGQKYGPVKTNQLKELAQTGKIQPEDLIWREGLPKWVTAAKAGLEFTSDKTQRTEAPTAPPKPKNDPYKNMSTKELGKALNSYVLVKARTTPRVFIPSFIVGMIVFIWQSSAYDYFSGLLFGTLTAFNISYINFVIHAHVTKDQEYFSMRNAIVDRRTKDSMVKRMYAIGFIGVFSISTIFYVILLLTTTLSGADTSAILLITFSCITFLGVPIERVMYRATPGKIVWSFFVLNLFYCFAGMSLMLYQAEIKPRQKAISAISSAMNMTKPHFDWEEWNPKLHENTEKHLQTAGVDFSLPGRIHGEKPDFPWLLMWEKNAFEVKTAKWLFLWGRNKSSKNDLINKQGHLTALIAPNAWQESIPLNGNQYWYIKKMPHIKFEVLSTEELRAKLSKQETVN